MYLLPLGERGTAVDGRPAGGLDRPAAGQPGGTPSPAEEQRWGQWFASLGDAITDRGNRAAPERTLASRQFDPGPATLTGYVVITADDSDSAAKLVADCPGLEGGVAVEIARVVDA